MRLKDIVALTLLGAIGFVGYQQVRFGNREKERQASAAERATEAQAPKKSGTPRASSTSAGSRATGTSNDIKQDISCYHCQGEGRVMKYETGGGRRAYSICNVCAGAGHKVLTRPSRQTAVCPDCQGMAVMTMALRGDSGSDAQATSCKRCVGRGWVKQM